MAQFASYTVRPCDEVRDSSAGMRPAATVISVTTQRTTAPVWRRMGSLLEDDQLPHHMGRMQVALDREHPGLVRGQLDVLGLVAVDDFLDPVGRDLVAMLVGVPVDQLQLDD